MFPYLFIAAGSFFMVGAAFRWPVFERQWRAMSMTRTYGTAGVRAFHFLFGAALSLAGVLGVLGYSAFALR